MNDTTTEQIAEQIAETHQRLAELQAVMAERRDTVTADVLADVRAKIEMYGLDAAQIAAALAPVVVAEKAKRTRKPVEPGSAKIYVLRGDESKTYSRGKMPTWMHQAMSAGGYDPAVKEDRERFKAEHMSLAA